MHRIFLPLYHFFRKHKVLMYLLLIASTLLFGYYGLQLEYEENIVKLLPRSSTDNELAFSDIGLKDKVFLQITSKDTLNPVDPVRLGEAMEEFCGMLEKQDEETRYIAGIFYTLDVDTALDAMDFALAHLPSFMDTSLYAGFEQALTREAIDEQMEENFQIIQNDETGEATQMVAMDPLNLRSVLLNSIMEGSSSMGGFTIEDGHLFCPDKTVALAFLTPAFDGLDSGAGTRFVHAVQQSAKAFEAANPDIHVLVHGTPLDSVSNASTIKRDLVWTIGLSMLLILIIIIMSFHRFSFVWQQVVPVIYGALFALACMYWIKGGVMSLMALGLSAIVLGVAISYCLHVLIHYYYVGDAEKLLRDESTPVFMGCITTVGAFMGLLFTESDLLRDFGLFATFSLIGNTFFALVFLPHFLHKDQIIFKRTHGFPLVEKFNNLPWDRNKWFIGALTLLIIIGVVMSPRVKFDSDLGNLDYDNATLKEAQDLYNTKNADGFAHAYFAAWDEQDMDKAMAYNIDFYRHLDSLQQAGVIKGYSPISGLVFRSTQDQQVRIQAWKQFWTRSRVAQLRRDLTESAKAYQLPANLFDSFFALLRQKYEPGNLIEEGIVPPGLLANFYESQESGRQMFFTEVSYPREDQNRVWHAITEANHVIVLEPFFYCRDMVEIIHEDFNTTLWISSIFVLLVLLFSFRNLWIALIAFLPMFVSWYVMQGYMAIFHLEFNLINIVISTFIYGIGVDYSIFVMEGLLAEARRGEKSMLNYHKVAIFYSAMVLAIVTFSLIFARHPAIHSIGLITLIGMASTILITYSLQPFIFRQLCKYRFFRRGFRIPEQ